MKAPLKRKVRGRAILVRLDDQELELLQREAGREPLASWARRILLERARRAGGRKKQSR